MSEQPQRKPNEAVVRAMTEIAEAFAAYEDRQRSEHEATQEHPVTSCDQDTARRDDPPGVAD
jgi:aminoglycoside N3'-acetyltransferase